MADNLRGRQIEVLADKLDAEREKERTPFDISAFVQAQNATVIGKNEDGSLIVEDNESKERSFLDGQAFMNAAALQEGEDPDNYELVLNTPATALPKSPLSFGQRMAVAMGNPRGVKDYLIKEFGDGKVAVTPDGLVVQGEDGFWGQIDPTTLPGDRWDVSEAITDVAEFIAREAPPAAGAALGFGSGLASGPGAFALGAGGAAVGIGMRHALGAYLGTYNPVPENSETPLEDAAQSYLTDTALDTALTVVPVPGSKLIGKAARPVVERTEAAFAKIGKTASDSVRPHLEALYGFTTGAGPQATKVMFDSTKKVMGHIKRASGRAGKSDQQVIDQLLDEQIMLSKRLLQRSTDALPKKYDEAMEAVFKSAEANGVTINVGKVASSAADQLIEKGFGKINAKGKFVQLDPADIALRRKLDLPTPGFEMDAESFSKISTVYNQLRAEGKNGVLKGRRAAKVLTSINKDINTAFKGQFGKNAQLDRAMAEASQAYRGAMNDAFSKTGLASKYADAINVYDRFADSVNQARGMLSQPQGAERFANSVLGAAGKKGTFRGFAKDLVELTGDSGQKLMDNITTREAAKKFAPYKFSLGFARSGIGLGGAAAGASGLISGQALLAGATQFSPRMVLNQVAGARGAIDGMAALRETVRGSVSNNKVFELLTNDRLWQESTRSIMRQMNNEAQYEQYLRDEGVLPQQ